MFSHPLSLLLFNNAVFTLTAAFTARKSGLRYVVLALMIGVVVLGLSRTAYTVPTTGWIGRIPAGALFWTVVLFFDRLILREWDWENYGPTLAVRAENMSAEENDAFDERRGQDSLIVERLAFGQEVSGEQRGIGNFWEVKSVPPFSSKDPRPHILPPLELFIARSAISLLLCSIVHDYAVDAQLSLNQNLVQPPLVPLLSRYWQVTAEELKANFVSTVGYWTVQYCMMQVFYSLFAIIAVCTAPSDLKLWRPLFGSIGLAFTLRGFWGNFWHQCLRSGLEGPANFLAHEVFRLPQTGVLQRYAKILVCFAISGAMHVAADIGGSLPMEQSGALRFFATQALGFVFEDFAQELHRRAFGRDIAPWIRTAAKTVGYVWVLLFLVWSTPIWVYPVTLKTERADALLRYSAIRPLFGHISTDGWMS